MPTNPDILLSTLNARYLHAAFGLRYLMANLGDLRSRARLLEFDINQSVLEIAESILGQNPRILGLGVYIWNVRPTTELVAILKRLRPDLVVILGGPEVSHEPEGQEIVGLADHVITGEADLRFTELCRRLLLGPFGDAEPIPKILHAALPDLTRLDLPYELYDERDIAHRVVYVEASRGCPFTCEFCLSSLDIPVRQFPLDRFLGAMQRLLDRGVLRFKFVDRTFNLHLPTSLAILRFFLDRMRPGLFVHFELVPDRLPEPLRELIARFPEGSLQFEVGLQTLNPEVEERISRRQNHGRMEDNLRWLRDHSGVHVHADLIVGLPGEDLESFGVGFDRLLALGPDEIQVGILKRLRGTPIVRHDIEWGMVYSPHPPYEVLETRVLDFATLARLKRFAAFWDLFANSGRFSRSLPLLWSASGFQGSAFVAFLAFSDDLHQQGIKTSGVALTRQFELLWNHAVGRRSIPPGVIAGALAADYVRAGRNDCPPWWREEYGPMPSVRRQARSAPPRQSRHLSESP
ncbi:MAG: DUF4080 domain-containing protein [Verrucomicrobiota bacterium]